MAIDSITALRDHLQTALELEHSTLPPYLCALYTLDAERNPAAAQVVRGVVLEEMLHLTLAANLLNAVGGSPVLDSPALLPGHPTTLPRSDGSVRLSLRPFSRAAVEGFLAVERPATTIAPAQDDRYATIGQFYSSIGAALTRMSATLGETQLFCGDPNRQVTEVHYYGGGGRVFAVNDLASACAALTEIVEQGEGVDHSSILDGDRDMFHHDRGEVAHYFRFQELLAGRLFAPGDTPSSGPTGELIAVDWAAVHPMPVDARSTDFAPGSEQRAAVEQFNSSYCAVLQLLEHTFNGVPTMLRIATGAMYGIKQQILDVLSVGAAPTFDWVPPERRRFPSASVQVVPHGPYLVRGGVDVFDALGDQRLAGGVCVLCRCGGSRTKPFCDGTHERIGFDGTETADTAPMASRRRAYPVANGAVVYDDRTRCAHFGQCTDRLPSVFGVDRSPGADGFIDPTGAPGPSILEVVTGCPSGALTAAPSAASEPVERHEPDSIRPIVDGPYRVRGGIPVVASTGTGYEPRERQTLCRCGQSRNKPFCDGSHWYAGFHDPAPTELDDVDPYPWTDPEAAKRGRDRYERTGHR